MRERSYEASDPKINHIKAEVQSDKVILTFLWPNTLGSVYIYKLDLLKEEEVDYDKPYRIYTREEYASFNGFIDYEMVRGLVKYIICPVVQEANADEKYLLIDEKGQNEIEVVASKIQIKYEVEERRKLFHPRKIVKMKVWCQVDMPREYLCYVKKRDGVPASREDGMNFAFIADFKAGDNILPEIEIDKDECVRIYLTEEVPHPEIYHLVSV